MVANFIVRTLEIRQRGMTLIISLFVMALVALIATTSLRAVIQAEKILNAEQNSDQLYQAAERALSHCEFLIRSGSSIGDLITNAKSLPEGWRENQEIMYSVGAKVFETGLSINPVCIVELLGESGSEINMERYYDRSSANNYSMYRVTSYAVGNDRRGEVMLESIVLY